MSLSSSSLSDSALRTLSSITSSERPLTSTLVTLAAVAGAVARQQARANSRRLGGGVIGSGYRCSIDWGLIGAAIPAFAGMRGRPSGRKMLDRRNAAQAIRQPLQQGQAVVAQGRVVDVDHHVVEERIDLRAQPRQVHQHVRIVAM